MTKKFISWMAALVVSLGLFSCSEDDNVYDAYANWPARNAEYFTQIVNQAQSAIEAAKRSYGDEWEAHCEWRMYKSTTKSPMQQGSHTDYICVRIEEQGTGMGCPISSDTVCVNYRGTLMPVQEQVNGEWVKDEKIFSQSFLGELNPAIAAPAKMKVSSAVAGFATALQYMHIGDKWTVYIPTELAYGGKESGMVLPYSTLTFFINLVDYYSPKYGD